MTEFFPHPGEEVKFRNLIPDNRFHGHMFFVGIDHQAYEKDTAVVRWERKEYRNMPPIMSYVNYRLPETPMDLTEMSQLHGNPVHVECSNGWSFDGTLQFHSYLTHGFSVDNKYVDANLLTAFVLDP